MNTSYLNTKSTSILCPQHYHGMEMSVTICEKCSSGWDAKLKRYYPHRSRII